MEDNKVYSVMETLAYMHKEHGQRFCYSFTIDTTGLTRFKISLYYKSNASGIQCAYSLSTNHIDEILQKLQKGINGL